MSRFNEHTSYLQGLTKYLRNINTKLGSRKGEASDEMLREVKNKHRSGIPEATQDAAKEASGLKPMNQIHFAYRHFHATLASLVHTVVHRASRRM